MYSETKKDYKEYFSGHTTLLLLAETSTPTASGLTTIFKKTNTFYLVLSVVWSMRTCLSIHLKSVALEKPFFPTTSKIFMSFWTTSTVVKRLMVLILYFKPGFGMFNLLNYWKS